MLVAGCSSLSLFDERELEETLCGEQVLDFEALRKVTRYQEPYNEQTPVIQWFWQILLNEFDDEQKKEFMKFTFGSARAPAGGLERQRFEIQKNGEDDIRLPTTHTCFGILMLPQYSSYDVLKAKLSTAIQNYEGFGLQ